MTRADVGIVHLVGAGPGDPELLTVKARRLLGEADVVLHDSLVGDAIIEACTGPSKTIVNVGKVPGDGRRWRQSDINRYMVEMANSWDTVVRLKGGDPCVFGRAGEEAEYLAARGIQFEIVPGVTSAIAAPEVAGIPVTHREISSSFTVLTGHEAASKDERSVDWEGFARRVDRGETVVIMMGVNRLPEYVGALRESGVADETPVAMIEKATWQTQQTVTATIGTIVDAAASADIQPPATTVIGDVVRSREAIYGQRSEAALKQ